MSSDKLFQKAKMRKNNELIRRKASKAPYETILIICEDSKSAPYYFRECIKLFKLNTANVIIAPSKGSAPISVVDYAIDIAKNTADIDQIFCILDRDNHESYDRAIDKIHNHKAKPKDKSSPKYTIISSTPCFEIWLLLHFFYTTKAYTATGKNQQQII